MAADSVVRPVRWLPPVATVYLSGMLQGLTLVSFPASSAVLKSMHGFSDAEYGAIFLPQVACAVLGALAGGSLASRWTLQRLLWIALLFNALSQLLLAGTVALPAAGAFSLVLVATGCLGFGFGLSGAPLNALPPQFFPQRRDTALVALHTLLGLGLALGPLLANLFVMADRWIGFPLLLAVFSLTVALTSFVLRFPLAAIASDTAAVQSSDGTLGGRDRHPLHSGDFWRFALIVVLYAFAEGTFGNWAVLYLQDVKQLPVPVAAAALSVFWAAIVAGRLLVSLLVLHIRPERIWVTLPILMVAAFLALPYADTAPLGIALFALAGLSCSAFFPLCIGLATQRFERHVPWVSSMLIAALMVGVGLGSYLVGLLREALAFERLYQFSTFYPAAALLLAGALLRSIRRSRVDATGMPVGMGGATTIPPH
jgi:fucose permease